MKPRHALIEQSNVYTVIKAECFHIIESLPPQLSVMVPSYGIQLAATQNCHQNEKGDKHCSTRRMSGIQNYIKLEIQINRPQVIYPVCPKLQVLTSQGLALNICTHLIINKFVKILLVFVKTVVMSSNTESAINNSDPNSLSLCLGITKMAAEFFLNSILHL